MRGDGESSRASTRDGAWTNPPPPTLCADTRSLCAQGGIPTFVLVVHTRRFRGNMCAPVRLFI